MRTKAYLAVEASLAGALFSALDNATRADLKEADRLLAAGKRSEASEVISKLSVVDAYAAIEDKVVYATNVAMLMGATMVSGSPQTTVVGLGFEQEAVAGMAAAAKNYLSSALEAVRASAMQLIAQTNSQDTVHKAEAPVIREFVSSLDEEGNVSVNLSAALHTSRVSCYGFTAEANVLGLTTYKVNEQMDKLTCPVCQHMHGKVFLVKDARALLKAVTKESDPEALKALQPWPAQSKEGIATLKAMTTEQLVAANLHTPPYHPWCRGLLARDDAEVTPGSDTIPTGPASYKATATDFTALGLPSSPAKLTNWNKNMKVAPVRVLSAVSGLTEAEILAESMTGTSAKEALGIVLSSFTKDTTTFAMTPPFYGQGPVAQVLRIQHDKATMQINSEAIGSAKVDGLDYLRAMYLLAKDLGLAKILMPVSGQGGPEWLKRGMYPRDLKEWERIKQHMATSDLAAGAVYSAEAHAKLSEILNSDDPKAALELLSVDPQVQSVLEGFDWVSGLSVDDIDSVLLLLKE